MCECSVIFPLPPTHPLSWCFFDWSLPFQSKFPMWAPIESRTVSLQHHPHGKVCYAYPNLLTSPSWPPTCRVPPSQVEVRKWDSSSRTDNSLHVCLIMFVFLHPRVLLASVFVSHANRFRNNSVLSRFVCQTIRNQNRSRWALPKSAQIQRLTALRYAVLCCAQVESDFTPLSLCQDTLRSACVCFNCQTTSIWSERYGDIRRCICKFFSSLRSLPLTTNWGTSWIMAHLFACRTCCHNLAIARSPCWFTPLTWAHRWTHDLQAQKPSKEMPPPWFGGCQAFPRPDRFRRCLRGKTQRLCATPSGCWHTHTPFITTCI